MILPLCALVLGVAVCDDGAPAESGGATLPDVDWEARYVGMEWRQTANDRTVEVLRADTGFAYSDSLVAIGFEVQQYDQQGREELRIRARRGVKNQKTDETIAIGDVILTVPSEGRTLRTHFLRRDPVTGRISSDSYSVVRTADGVFCGYSFESDLDLRDAHIPQFRTGEANCPWPGPGGRGSGPDTLSGRPR